ncbi:MAG: LuxR C-terminal-related transcriptional regulator [Anaerolineae bacterium]|nr:LuxR C-terminal-related transcriptional regulator [Anaerolineae bacterium]
MSAQLLATKLRVPPRSSELVPRARLLDRLDQGLQRKLILVSAPAGFGKTTLVAEWVARRASEVCFAIGWLTLETSDNDLVRFLNYLAAAVGDALPGIAAEIQPRLEAPHPTPTEEILTALINRFVAANQPGRDQESRPELVLVLDDYHLITAAEIHEAVAFLLEHQPAGLHLVLLTRADPPLPLPRLRSQGQLVELRQGDLRFTAAEAAVFLQEIMQLSLGVLEVETLTRRTEGWIAGLQMAALALRGRHEEEAAAFVAGFTGTHRYVLDYLLEEVLQRQPASVQQFLLETSILERLSAPLCDAVRSGDAQPPVPSRELLDYLDRHNLFLVPLDEHRSWYRYYRLFADLLQLRLRQAIPARLAELHERAAAWHEAAGETGAAVTHLLAAGNVTRAATLVADHAEGAVMHGEMTTLLAWVDALPEEEIAARPYLALLYAWAMLLAGRPANVVEYWLQMMEAREDTAGWTNAIRAYVQLFEGNPLAARQLAERALSTLPAQTVFLRQLAGLVQSIAVRYQENGRDPDQALDATFRTSAAADNTLIAVLGLCLRAELAYRRGDLAEAAVIYEQALALAQTGEERLLPVASEPLLGLATLALEQFDLARAEELLEAGLALTREWSGVAALDGYLLRVRLHYLRGEHQAVWAVLDEAAELARQFDAVETDDLLVALARTQMELHLGRLGAARRWLEARALQADAVGADLSADLATHAASVRKYEYLLLARLLVAEGRPEEALQLLGRLLPHFDRLRTRVTIHLLQALAHEQRREDEAALAALSNALSLGERTGLIAVFAEEGEPVARLLYHALETGIAPDYASRLLGVFPAIRDEERAAARERMVEPLSERETEVLALVAEGLTNQEIAARLYLSLATVKWHTSNIYGKLAVGNRMQAVAKARTLGVLPAL